MFFKDMTNGSSDTAAVPKRVFIVYQYVKSKNGISRNDLKEALEPAYITSDIKLSTSVINAAEELGLIKQEDGFYYQKAPDLKTIEDMRRYINGNINSIKDGAFYKITSEIFNMTKTNDFIFLDPPYDCVFTDYGNIVNNSDFSEENHRKLAQDFKNLGCKALMIIGKTELTESLYKSYIKKEYPKNYAVNIRNRFKSEAMHLIITNFDK